MSPAAHRPRVLVVDDEPDLLAILASLLHIEGFEVSTAGDGPEAIARARSEHFDVVVTDLKLPGMDGLEILSTIGAFDPAARPVLMTGFVSEETRAMLTSQGYSFVLKPFEIEEIVALIEHAAASQ